MNSHAQKMQKIQMQQLELALKSVNESSSTKFITNIKNWIDAKISRIESKFCMSKFYQRFRPAKNIGGARTRGMYTETYYQVPLIRKGFIQYCVVSRSTNQNSAT